MTFVIVTHELPSVYTVASRVILLAKDAQTVVAEGTPRQLQNDPGNPWAWQFFNRQPQTTRKAERPAGYETRQGHGPTERDHTAGDT